MSVKTNKNTIKQNSNDYCYINTSVLILLVLQSVFLHVVQPIFILHSCTSYEVSEEATIHQNYEY
jgi:hypothetical protein